ncbi:MAG: ABC transporter ATP-binding protein [Bdellovibrio sp. CG10_big_fil_rev_8_21_14_0_10_47_8]|nr:MAG: ABC transporter ATP-binding protein [Bdellovibrio sp. CG10_big_fil_rev_8_21_14_0_10_47_8]
MESPVLEMTDVSVRFDEDLVLEEVNLKIYPKETAVVIGLSGSGKTVLLKTLAGLYHPSKGHVKCYGRDWDDLSVIGRHDLAQKVGMQFQKSALFDDLTAYENVAYPLKEHSRSSKEEIHARVMECLKAVDLEKAKGMLPFEMSGGMKQRLGIARAIALKPEILFMDDPTAGLDPINSDNMADLILALKEEIGSTLVIVTHDLSRAYQFAGRIFFVGSHRVLETGSADETKNHPDPRVQQYLQGRLTGPLTDAGDL